MWNAETNEHGAWPSSVPQPPSLQEIEGQFPTEKQTLARSIPGGGGPTIPPKHFHDRWRALQDPKNTYPVFDYVLDNPQPRSTS